MKKFVFALDKVLDYKEQILESAQGEHAIALAQLRQQEEILEQAWQSYRDYNEEFCEKKQSGMLIVQAVMYQSGLRTLEAQIQKETERLEQCRAEEEKKRAAVVEARKETASLEKLREKKLDGYKKAVQKSEELLIEEFVSAARATAPTA